MQLDDERRASLGIGPGADGPVFGAAVMNYVCGVVTRERERLARLFDAQGMPEIAAGIRDDAMDDNVFKWAPPSADLDAKPKTAAERKAAKDAKKQG